MIGNEMQVTSISTGKIWKYLKRDKVFEGLYIMSRRNESGQRKTMEGKQNDWA